MHIWRQIECRAHTLNSKRLKLKIVHRFWNLKGPTPCDFLQRSHAFQRYWNSATSWGPSIQHLSLRRTFIFKPPHWLQPTWRLLHSVYCDLLAFRACWFWTVPESQEPWSHPHSLQGLLVGNPGSAAGVEPPRVFLEIPAGCASLIALEFCVQQITCVQVNTHRSAAWSLLGQCQELSLGCLNHG